jgi:hypothetical protein
MIHLVYLVCVCVLCPLSSLSLSLSLSLSFFLSLIHFLLCCVRTGWRLWYWYWYYSNPQNTHIIASHHNNILLCLSLWYRFFKPIGRCAVLHLQCCYHMLCAPCKLLHANIQWYWYITGTSTHNWCMW